MIPPHGALPEIVNATGAGIDTGAGKGEAREFAEALMAIWRGPDQARQYGRQGFAAVRDRFTLEHMAGCVEAVYGEAAGQPVPGRGHVPYARREAPVTRLAP